MTSVWTGSRTGTCEPRESRICAAARERFERLEGGPLFMSEWSSALFIHYEVDPDVLQKQVPFALDLCGGRAFVSLVAFTMRDLRLALPAPFSRIGRLLTSPVATHELLNVRTYVRNRNEPGIYFMAEWIPNALSAIAGPRTYGLPYRLAKMKYVHDRHHVRGEVVPLRTEGRLRYEATIAPHTPRRAQAGSLREHLLERYTAYTMQPPGNRSGLARRFRVWHEPWLLADAEVRLIDDTALAATGDWHLHAQLIAAEHSAGANNVLMSRPRRVA